MPAGLKPSRHSERCRGGNPGVVYEVRLRGLGPELPETCRTCRAAVRVRVGGLAARKSQLEPLREGGAATMQVRRGWSSLKSDSLLNSEVRSVNYARNPGWWSDCVGNAIFPATLRPPSCRACIGENRECPHQEKTDSLAGKPISGTNPHVR